MDRRSAAELRLAEALATEGATDGGGPGDRPRERVERAPRGRFGPGFAELLGLAEDHPRLSPRLLELASLRAAIRARRAQLVGAAIGPALTLLAATLACGLLAAWVLPTFDRWLEVLGFDAPPLYAVSRAAMGVVFGAWGAVGLLAAAAAATLAYRAGLVSRWVFRLRVAAAPVQAAVARSLEIAVESGLPAADSLELAAAVTSHRYASARLRALRSAAESGTPMWQLLSRSGVIPAKLLATVRAGDGETLASSLSGLASYYEVEAAWRARSAPAWIGAAVTVAAAGLCLWLAVTIASGYVAAMGVDA